MRNEKKKVAYTKVFIIVVVAVILGLTLYCMVNHMGLIDDLDFGAGAYYYADIPEFTQFVNRNAYQSEMPMWVLTALFLAWGSMMYWLWSWIEKKTTIKKQDEFKKGAENEI